MLMTFPTKESLLRNLNEREVSEVFLIIANFKSLAGWNLIPLRNLTILLGPNSAGKSTIYEAIDVIRNFSHQHINDIGRHLWQRFRRGEDDERPCVGFTMPYLLKDEGMYFDSVFPVLSDLLFRKASEGSYGASNALNDVCESNALSCFFILEGMNPGGYLNQSLKNMRYTLLSIDGLNPDYEVYLNGVLASASSSYEEGTDHDITIKIYPYANEVLYLPSVIFRNNLKNKELAKAEILREYLGHSGSIENLKHHTGIIGFNLGETGMTFRQGLPHGIFAKEAKNNYGPDTVAFCMVIALYQLSYHLFLEYISGGQTDEVRAC